MTLLMNTCPVIHDLNNSMLKKTNLNKYHDSVMTVQSDLVVESELILQDVSVGPIGLRPGQSDGV